MPHAVETTSVQRLTRFLTELISETNGLSLEQTLDLAEHSTLGELDPEVASLTREFHALLAAFRIDPYVGVGAAWVLAGDLESVDLDLLEIGEVEVDDEFTYVLNAGLGVHFTNTFGLYLDAKYIPLEPATRAAGDPEDVEIEINPVIFSAGLKFRF